MKSKLKKVLILLMSVMLLSAAMFSSAYAAGAVDPDYSGSLIITFKDGNTPIPDASFRLYKVAVIDEDAHFTLTPEFESYRASISGLNELDTLPHGKWANLAYTLSGYVMNENFTPDYEGRTDSTGTLSFTGMRTGFYLMLGSNVKLNGYTYRSVPYMISIPGENPDTHNWVYDISTNVKFTKEENKATYFPREVMKIWDDSGYESVRPVSVRVHLLCDGVVYDSQTLNKENNWHYKWEQLSSDHSWEIIEDPMDNYAVTVARSGVTFTVTNKYVTPIIGTNLPVQKRIVGDTPKVTSAFTFVFTAKDDSYPMPKGSTGNVKEITIAGAGSQEIGSIDFKRPGVYVYTLSEKNTGIKGYTYDTNVYTITFNVTEKNGKLVVNRTIYSSNGTAATALEFTNPYNPPDNKLPQTGVLWWPIPLLAVGGILFVVAGIIRRRRYN